MNRWEMGQEGHCIRSRYSHEEAALKLADLGRVALEP